MLQSPVFQKRSLCPKSTCHLVLFCIASFDIEFERCHSCLAYTAYVYTTITGPVRSIRLGAMAIPPCFVGRPRHSICTACYKKLRKE